MTAQTSPARNTDCKIATKYRAATTCEIAWTKPGVLCRSNTKPERMKAGRKVVISAICPATNWLRATVEITSPMPSVASMNSAAQALSTTIEPCRGTPKRNTAIATEPSIPPIPSTK